MREGDELGKFLLEVAVLMAHPKDLPLVPPSDAVQRFLGAYLDGQQEVGRGDLLAFDYEGRVEGQQMEAVLEAKGINETSQDAHPGRFSKGLDEAFVQSDQE